MSLIDPRYLRACAFCKAVEKLTQVEACRVDDFHEDGFNIFLYPKKMDGLFTTPRVWTGQFQYSLRGLLNRVHALIRKYDGHFEWADGPEMQYRYIGDGQKVRDHYSRDNYKLSIRFPTL